MNLLLIAGGLVLLILGGNWLLKAAVGFSLRLQIPKIVIGMTVVSFATSAPELIVSLKSALNGEADLALGNVIGSNIANLGLVLAITILISTISVENNDPMTIISDCAPDTIVGPTNFISGLIKIDQHKIYPNPSKGNINLIFNVKANRHVILYDLFGKDIESYNSFNSKIVIERNNLEKGVYFIRIENLDDNQFVIEKLIIE